MATYIKGADAYLPDIQPFTPDYKFLSQVVNTRTDKYDANFKATNDLYNKVVYADLSRQDTKDRRDQYAQQIGPQIEKISGLDLSLQSNVDAAKGVFAPFFQDDLTVRDIVYTSRYKDEMAYANLLQDSPNKDRYEKWWDVGVKKLNYEMQDFINSSASQALRAPLPKYVEDADLAILADQILSSMDPPLKRKVDYFNRDADGNVQPEFIITEQNGRQVTGEAENILRNQLLQNPKVQAAYYADAYVKSRDFAANAMKNGMFQTTQQGQDAWAEETIKRIESRVAAETTPTIQEKQKLLNANVNWENYQANNGIIPGSDMDLGWQDQQQLLDATEAALNAKLEMRELAAKPVNSSSGLLNKAYNLIMNYNIMGDIRKAATDFASRDYEYSIEVNDLYRDKKNAEYAWARDRENARDREKLEGIKSQNAYNLAVAKGEIISPVQKRLLDILNKPAMTFGDAGSLLFPSDEDGELDGDFDPIELYKEQYEVADNDLHKMQVDGIVDMLVEMHPEGNTELKNNTYVIKSPGPVSSILYEGTPENLRKQLMYEESLFKVGGMEISGGEQITANQRTLINNIFNRVGKEFTNRRQLVLDNPNSIQDPQQYDELYNRIFTGPGSVVNYSKSIDAVNQESAKRMIENYDKIDDFFQNSKRSKYSDARDGRANGLGSILDPNGLVMSRKAFINQAIELAKNGQLTNWDSDGPDPGIGVDKNYMSEIESTPGSSVSITTTGASYSPGRLVKSYGLNEAAVEADAGRYYDLYYEALKKGLRGDKTFGTLEPISFKGIASGSSETFQDSYSVPNIVFRLDPSIQLDPTIQAQNDNALGTLFQQIDSFQGRPYGVLAGNLEKNDMGDLLTKDPVAQKVLEMWRSDYAQYLANPQKNPDKPIPRAMIIQKPVYGLAEDGDKQYAGYQIVFDETWLASKQQGSPTTTGEYGPLSSRDIKSLSGIVLDGDDDLAGTQGGLGNKGISIIFDQEEDISQYAFKNQYYSYVETDILLSDTDTYKETVPGDIQNTATFSIVKDADNIYRVLFNSYHYNPYNPQDKTGGNYIPKTGTARLEFSKGFDLRSLDAKVNEFRANFEKLRSINRTAYESDLKRYGIKKPNIIPLDSVVKDNRPQLSLPGDAQN